MANVNKFTPVVPYSAVMHGDYSGASKFDEVYENLETLNLVTKISEGKLKPLCKQDIKTGTRQLNLYLSYRGELISVGYLDNRLVFAAYTDTADLLKSRRIFEIMSGDSFFVYADDINDAFENTDICREDILQMARIRVAGLEREVRTITGPPGFVSPQERLNGDEFAEVIYDYANEVSEREVSPAGMRKSDEIIKKLTRTLNRLDSIANSDALTAEEKSNEAHAVTQNWFERNDLFLSRRPAVRRLYHSILMHPLISRKSGDAE
jgi:hypothetical protein